MIFTFNTVTLIIILLLVMAMSLVAITWMIIKFHVNYGKRNGKCINDD